jgi:hypothetical protein
MLGEFFYSLNARDQRRRVVGVPLARTALGTPLASGVTTRDDRCIA